MLRFIPIEKKMNSFIKFLVGGKEKILEDLVDRRTVSE